MKKEVKKIISKMLPKGGFKEKIKLAWYNFLIPKPISFELVKEDSDKLIYKTTYQDVSLLTNEALYFIAPDFNYYQHLYKAKPSDVVLDAGANCGHLSIYFSKIIGENGKCYAFEPDVFNIERIKNNMQLNDLDNNIIIEELLLWNENKFVDFYEAGTVGSSAVWIPETDKCVKKEAVTIDSWVEKNNIKALNFIKMDIEGAEIEALEGCIETIKTLAPNFAIASYHIVNNEPTYIKLEAFFKKLNYPYKTVKFRGNEIITFAGFQQ